MKVFELIEILKERKQDAEVYVWADRGQQNFKAEYVTEVWSMNSDEDEMPYSSDEFLGNKEDVEEYIEEGEVPATDVVQIS